MEPEDIEDAELAAERYRDHLRSGEASIPLAGVFADLGPDYR